MDGRITALRVGFLSSSHQLAGVEFSIASSPCKKNVWGSYPFIGIFFFVGYCFNCCCWLVLSGGVFDFGVRGSFSPLGCLKRVRAGELWRCKSGRHKDRLFW